MLSEKVFNNNCYILTNFSDSNNPLFTSKEEVENFKFRVKSKIGSLVEIMAWSFHTDHYQILACIKSREEFESFYKQKHNSPDMLNTEIPESYLILSQEMSNIQSGYAKWFNHRHKRYGSLFGRRYTKILLETKQEVQQVVQDMNNGKKIWDFEKLWSYVWNFLKEQYKQFQIMDTSKGLYGEGNGLVKCWFPGFLRFSEWDLRGRYEPSIISG